MPANSVLFRCILILTLISTNVLVGLVPQTHTTAQAAENFAPETQAGGILYVKTDGDDNNDCTTWDMACKTIQATINKSADGDTIHIDPGTYFEHITIDRDITLKGTSAAENVILDGSNSGRVVYVNPAVVATLANLTITHGYVKGGDGGPGSDGTPGVDATHPEFNGAHGGVGEDGQPGDPGLAAQGGGIYNAGNLTLSNVTVQENSVNGGTGGPGGISGNGGNGFHGCVDPGWNGLECTWSLGRDGGNGGAAGGGGAGGDGGNGQGGGIYNAATLNVMDALVIKNTAAGGAGGTAGIGGDGGNGAYGSAATSCLWAPCDGGDGGAGGAGGSGGEGGTGGAGEGGGIYNAAAAILGVTHNLLVSDNNTYGGHGTTGGAGGSAGISAAGGMGSEALNPLFSAGHGGLGGAGGNGGGGGNGAGGGAAQGGGISNKGTLIADHLFVESNTAAGGSGAQGQDGQPGTTGATGGRGGSAHCTCIPQSCKSAGSGGVGGAGGRGGESGSGGPGGKAQGSGIFNSGEIIVNSSIVDNNIIVTEENGGNAGIAGSGANAGAGGAGGPGDSINCGLGWPSTGIGPSGPTGATGIVGIVGTIGANGIKEGGGIYNAPASSPALKGVIFSGNAAGDGGGMYNNSSNLTLVETEFINNNAKTDGGGIYNHNSSPPLVNVSFMGNAAENNGGGMYNEEANPTLANVVFSRNQSSGCGGGLNTTSGSPELVNVTFSGNSADTEGGGICIDGGSPTLKNSILWGNIANTLIDREKQVYSKVSFVLEDSLVQHGCALSWGCGSNIITIDPQFVDAANDDLRLRGTSPAVDGGNDVHLPADTLDLDGDLDTSEQLPVDRAGGARIYGNSVDMGAYETQCYEYEIDKGDDLLDQGRDYRVDFHSEDSTKAKTIAGTIAAYNEAVIAHFQQADEHYAKALACAVTEDQKRDAIEGRFSARWEIATGSMLQGNDQMVQALDVETNNPLALTDEIKSLQEAIDWYSPATDLYKELLTDGLYTEFIDKNGERTDPISGQTMSDMERLAQASAKKSRAFLELAERQFRKYAKDEAEETLRQGIALAIVEQALLASLWPESNILQEDVSYQALGRNISGMQRLFDYLVENKNPLGYGPEYVAFHYQPKNDEPGGKRQNNYEQTAVLASVKQKSAEKAVDDAEDYKGRVDDDFEKLQKDLENIRDKYDKQQVEICGTNDDLEPDLDACFTNPGGRMYEQMERIDEAHYRLQLVQVQMENQQQLINIEQVKVRELTGAIHVTWELVNKETEEALGYDASRQDESLQTAGKVLQGVNSIVSGAISGGKIGPISGFIGGASSLLGFIGGEMGGPSEEAQLLDELKRLQEAELKFKGLELQLQENEEVIKSAAIVKRLVLRFAELNVERAVAMSNLQQELARLEGLITQLQYTQAEQRKAEGFAQLWQDPAARVMRDYWMELANDRFDVAMDYAYQAGRALDYEINQDITYSGLPLTHLEDLYEIHDATNLAVALVQMGDAYDNWLGSVEIPSPQKARDRVYLSQAVGFEDSYDPALDRIVTREEKFNAFLRDPANWIDLDDDGTPESVRFTFQTSIFLGNQFFATSVFNDKISSIEMRVRGSDLGDEQVVLHLSQSGTSFMRTQNAFKYEGSDDIRTYNIAAQKARITAATNESILPAEIAVNRELATRSVAFTTWTLTIDKVHEPNNFDLNIEDIEEIELAIVHEAYTLQGIGSMGATQVEGAPSIFEPPPNREYQPIAAPGFESPFIQPMIGISVSSLANQSASDLTGAYIGAVLIDESQQMPPLDLGLMLVDKDGALSGYIDPTRAAGFSVSGDADGQKLGPEISGSWSGVSFTLQSEEYTNDYTPGITRQIVLDSGVISENGNILSGVYSETLTGLAPEPIVITGDFQLYRSAKDLPPMADFTAVPRSGSAPLTVQFSDQSGGVPNTWNWDFGDGATSTEQNPSHTYTENGQYTVTLQVDYETDEPSTVTKTNYIIVAEPTEPRAAFSASPLYGIAPLTVTFTDESGGVPSSWSWDFGDGGTSTEQHPTHTYTQEGLYGVTLTISNDIGSDTKFSPNYVNVADSISIYLPLTMSNVDLRHVTR